MFEQPPTMTAAPAFDTAGFDVALRQVLRAGRRFKWLFLGCFVGVAAVGFVALMIIPPTYQATATVSLTQPSANPISPNMALVADPTEDNDWPLTVALMMQSPDVASAVLAAFPPPPASPSWHDRLCEAGAAFLCRPAVSSVALKTVQIDRFLKTLTVLPEPNSRVIKVSVQAADPTRAANLADAVVQAYQQIALAQQATDAERKADWLNQRTAALNQSWLAARAQADRFSASHHLTIATTGAASGPLVEQQIGAVAADLAVAQSQLDSAESQSEALHDASAYGGASGMVALSANPVMVAMSNTLMQLQNTRDQLSAEFGPNYPKIEALDRQIATTTAGLNRQTGTALSGIRANLVAAKRQVQQLTRQLTALRAQSAAEGPYDTEYTVLSTKAASLGAEYQAFLQHANDAMDQSLLLQPPVTLVSAAEIPLAPAYPAKAKFTLGILFLALVTSTASVLIKDRATQGFGRADDLRMSVRLPLLAMLPSLSNTRCSIGRHVLEDPYSRTSETVRGLAATLALRAGEDGGAQSILITSAGALEGKSTVATWLALTVRKTGQSVLLVDGDHRRGTLMQDVATKDAPGFTDLLAGKARLDEVLQVDPQTGLTFMTAGTTSARSFGTAEIAVLRDLINTLKNSFSLIVIDSPPLLAMVDGLVLGSVADQTVFICRWQFSSRQSVIAMLDRIRSYGAKVSGIVVSMVDQNETIDFDGEYSRREFKLINRLYGT